MTWLKNCKRQGSVTDRRPTLNNVHVVHGSVVLLCPSAHPRSHKEPPHYPGEHPESHCSHSIKPKLFSLPWQRACSVPALGVLAPGQVLPPNPTENSRYPRKWKSPKWHPFQDTSFVTSASSNPLLLPETKMVSSLMAVDDFFLPRELVKLF